MTDSIRIDIAAALTERDLEEIARLVPQLSSTAVFDPDRVRSMVEHPATALFVARSSDGIVGMGTLVIFPLPTGRRGLIEDVVVDSSERGHGVARRLLEEILAESTLRGLRTVDLTSRPARESALRLYESVGFVRRETNVLRYIPPPDR